MYTYMYKIHIRKKTVKQCEYTWRDVNHVT